MSDYDRLLKRETEKVEYLRKRTKELAAILEIQDKDVRRAELVESGFIE